MSKATVTIEGYVSRDPETKDVSGHRVTEVTVPHTPRKFNKQTDQWEDAGDTQWWVAEFWDADGDAIQSAVTKGRLVTVTGQPAPRAYSKNDGAAGIALGLKFATLGIIPRASSNGGGGDQWAQNQPTQTQGSADAWATPGSFDDSSPF